ncbi:MAG: UDP-glucose 4-epimerase GalE [Acidobacteria bacterium]|nr:MAG: UDP-glucose 4-epimerase GalE [Acidobacteriota bacterium]
MSTVLVTGGAGYIGSHAVKALARAGVDVVVYDNLTAGHRAAVDALVSPAGAGGTRGRVTLTEGDVRDMARLTETLRRSGAKAVMHFAALLSVGDSVNDPGGYYDNNVGGTLSVLGAMVEAGVRHFIFSSTAAVFGDPIETPITEDHPKMPINAYGETKLAIERALPHFDRAYGLRWTALRYFNAAGADPDGVLGEDHDPEIHVVPRAIDAALGRASFAIYGDDYETPDGTCLRDFIHVADLAAAHVLALQALASGAPSTTYNLGNGQPISVREVVEAVERVTGRQVPYTVAARRPGDPGVLFASSDRIKRELGWRPRYERIDTIVETAWRWRAAHPAGYAEGVRS